VQDGEEKSVWHNTREEEQGRHQGEVEVEEVGKVEEERLQGCGSE